MIDTVVKVLGKQAKDGEDKTKFNVNVAKYDKERTAPVFQLAFVGDSGELKVKYLLNSRRFLMTLMEIKFASVTFAQKEIVTKFILII